ncbi:MAG TPA: histidinol-phosphate transaminase [Patescibacteria group bacterium]|nr:histidinol-phosphate transaminase [Patescibacteria group bacterium]
MTAQPLPKQGILDIKPYIGGEGRVAGVTDLLRLASNENALGCSPKAREAYLNCANDLFRYPDGSALELRTALGKTYNMNPDNIICGSGSEELISLLVRAYAGPGDEVLFPQYGFLMYPICAKAVGATPVTAPENDFRSDVGALLKAITPKTKMLLLANPNNPTGSYITREELKHLCEKVPSNILILLDSAYAEFVQAADYSDGRDMVDAHPNVVMLRTFSKIYGLAALRLGWGYCSPEVAGVVNRVRGAFNVNAPAQAAGVAALSDSDFLKRTIEMTTTGRAYLAENIGALGFRVLPSVGNFLLVEFGDKAEDIRLSLKDKGIFIRQMGAYNLPRHLRVTVGTADDNQRLVAALKAATGR